MLEQLRADSKNKATPIIVLSNSAQDGDIEIAKQHGATAFLLKAKITPAKLAAEVEKLV
jgi:CheY-like chemotaxis protein